MKQITLDEFFQKHKPVKNPLVDNAPDDNTRFETYGEELEFILKEENSGSKKVWTVLDVDGREYITTGYHLVNRMGYYITEVPYEEEMEIDVDKEFDYGFNTHPKEWTAAEMYEWLVDEGEIDEEEEPFEDVMDRPSLLDRIEDVLSERGIDISHLDPDYN